jgi:hypothetical protein
MPVTPWLWRAAGLDNLEEKRRYLEGKPGDFLGGVTTTQPRGGCLTKHPPCGRLRYARRDSNADTRIRWSVLYPPEQALKAAHCSDTIVSGEDYQFIARTAGATCAGTSTTDTAAGAETASLSGFPDCKSTLGPRRICSPKSA